MDNKRFDFFDTTLHSLAVEGRLRRIPRAAECRYDLCTNDYLSLAQDSHEERVDFMTHSSSALTSSASRLLAAEQKSADRLEKYLSEMYRRGTLLFNSGYHANAGALSALSVKGAAIVSDKLIHASAIDGIRLGHGENFRFRHNDVSHLTKILERIAPSMNMVVVVVESLYSMDGDEAPIAEIVELKKRYDNVLLYVDEAHSVGVRGPRGLGICAQRGVMHDVDIIVGTFGKALASSGAFVAAQPNVIDYLVNTARSFIFSTALPPICHEWTLRMLSKVADMDDERDHLAKISTMFREGIEHIQGEKNPSTSQIVPLIIGGNDRTVDLSRRLLEAGVNVLPIRKPTVPAGTERLRFSLHSSLSEDDVRTILHLIKQTTLS